MEYTEKGKKILETAKDLFAKKGFKAVTTKEIAIASQVNEVTIFRLFGKKENLFNQMLEYSVAKPDLAKFLKDDEVHLENYLKGVGRLIQHIFTNNLEIFKIELFERQMANRTNRVSKIPILIREKMIQYLSDKQNMNKSDAELFATSFMSSVHGLCMNIYFTKTFEPQPNFEDCFKFIVQKFK